MMEFEEKFKELINSDNIQRSYLAFELAKTLGYEYINLVKELYIVQGNHLNSLCNINNDQDCYTTHPTITCKRLRLNRQELNELVKECDHILNKCVETIENTDKTGSE